jgi:hypothetical protein
MICYLLGIASPTYDISVDCYNQAWARGSDMDYSDFVDSSQYNGIDQIFVPAGRIGHEGMPLFWIHYSFLGFDPNGVKDGITDTIDPALDFADIFKNIASIDRAYCMNDSPYNAHGYGANMWGLTAGYGEDGYGARYPDGGGSAADDGTIAPTAAISSMPYFNESITSNEAFLMMKNLYNNYGDVAWGPFGFEDGIGFHTDGDASADWSYDGYVAIDQGPIIIMIENYRTKLLWRLFMSHPDIQALLVELRGNGWTITEQVYN